MKAKCINSDPLEWVKKGNVYDCIVKGNVVVVSAGLVLSKERFLKDFEIEEEQQ